MYGIFTYIYHKHIQKNLPNVGEYTSPMDGMGILGGLFVERSLFTSPGCAPDFFMFLQGWAPENQKISGVFFPQKKVGLFHPPGSSIRNLFGCFIRDPFRGENVTSIGVIKRSLGRSWQLPFSKAIYIGVKTPFIS